MFSHYGSQYGIIHYMNHCGSQYGIEFDVGRNHKKFFYSDFIKGR